MRIAIILVKVIVILVSIIIITRLGLKWTVIVIISSINIHYRWWMIFIVSLVIHLLDFIEIKIFLMKTFVKNVSSISVISKLHFHFLVSEFFIDLRMMNEISVMIFRKGNICWCWWLNWSFCSSCFFNLSYLQWG